jgi:hypothetical protein
MTTADPSADTATILVFRRQESLDDMLSDGKRNGVRGGCRGTLTATRTGF